MHASVSSNCRPVSRLTAMWMLVVAVSAARGEEPRVRHCCLQGFPPQVQARLELRERLRARQAGGVGPLSIVEVQKTWEPDQRISVAFRGGSYSTRRKIMQAARPWDVHGGLTFDFGHDPAAQSFREWTADDRDYAADIRIAFDGKGYWSAVGKDSRDAQAFPPQEASLNLGGFDKELPPLWQSVVLHEFGHALGFQHEHQSPEGGCEAHFCWNDDPGYEPTRNSYGEFVPDKNGRRPGLYTVFGGPPTEWCEAIVDQNLRQLPKSSAFATSRFDPQSIMCYQLPKWMVNSGGESCAVESPPIVLSPLDIEGVKRFYPSDPEQREKVRRMRRGDGAARTDAPAGATAADKPEEPIETPPAAQSDTVIVVAMSTAFRVRDPQVDLNKFTNIFVSGVDAVKEGGGSANLVQLKSPPGIGTKAELFSHLGRINVRQKQRTTLVCYLKLHGRTDARGDHWFQLDPRGRRPAETVRRSEVLEYLKQCGARHTVLVVDSCRTTDLEPETLALEGRQAAVEMFSDLFLRASGCTDLHSCAPGEPAWMNGAGEAIFTDAFSRPFVAETAEEREELALRIDRDGNGTYTWEEFFAYLGRETQCRYEQLRRDTLLGAQANPGRLDSRVLGLLNLHQHQTPTFWELGVVPSKP